MKLGLPAAGVAAEIAFVTDVTAAVTNGGDVGDLGTFRSVERSQAAPPDLNVALALSCQLIGRERWLEGVG